MSENVTLWFHLHNILEKTKYIEIVEGSVIFWGIEEGHGGGINKWSTEGFEGCKTILCVTVIVHDTIHLSKAIELYNTKREP